ncbi:MAG TPA: SMP-30/gluconolactonase/LRE family protein [Aestuariivirga sp.]|nr:SMP-30/gluconolactonase/LRE family protein [Aestuariivirga sp.]
MAKLPVTHAAALQFGPNFNLLKAMRSFGTIVAVLLFTTGFVLAADSLVIAPGAKLEVLGEGLPYADGPAADRDGNVFFTHPLTNGIVKWNAADGKFSDWLTQSGYAKGLAFDKAGNLLAAAVERGELWSIAPDKAVTVLATNVGGKQFNGPANLWIRPDGGVYFTDPYYRTTFLIRDPTARMAGQHVYFMAPDRKTVTQVSTDLLLPYGITGTPDGKMLYVGDIVGQTTWVYDIRPGGELTNKRLFYDRSSEGMTIDVEGNIYLTRNGVTVFNKKGEKIEQIDLPKGLTTNVTFGGKNRDLLFITTTDRYVYGLKMRVKGVH